VLASAGGRAQTLGGVPIGRSPILARNESPLEALRNTNTTWTRRAVWEPKWFDPSGAIDAAARLRISNFPDFSAGLGATSTVPEDLRLVRNYLAHRHRTTADKLVDIRRRGGMPATVRPEEIPRWILGDGTVVITAWAAELVRLAQQAAS
jgi:hypothetical protein